MTLWDSDIDNLLRIAAFFSEEHSSILVGLKIKQTIVK